MGIVVRGEKVVYDVGAVVEGVEETEKHNAVLTGVVGALGSPADGRKDHEVEASPPCASNDPEVLVGTVDLEEHESDHEERVFLPSADSEAGHEGEVCNLVDDAI